MPTLKKTVQRPWQPKRGVQEGRLYPNTKFYQSTAWRKLRNLKLEQCSLCKECQRRGITTLAQVVDHIVPINRDGAKLNMAKRELLLMRRRGARYRNPKWKNALHRGGNQRMVRAGCFESGRDLWLPQKGGGVKSCTKECNENHAVYTNSFGQSPCWTARGITERLIGRIQVSCRGEL